MPHSLHVWSATRCSWFGEINKGFASVSKHTKKTFRIFSSRNFVWKSSDRWNPNKIGPVFTMFWGIKKLWRVFIAKWRSSKISQFRKADQVAFQDPISKWLWAIVIDEPIFRNYIVEVEEGGRSQSNQKFLNLLPNPATDIEPPPKKHQQSWSPTRIANMIYARISAAKTFWWWMHSSWDWMLSGMPRKRKKEC